MPRLSRMPVALNVDGLERKRKKWNRLAQDLVSAFRRWLATFCPNAVVTDAVAIEEYYRERYRQDSVMIPYGAELGAVGTRDVLDELGLEPAQNTFSTSAAWSRRTMRSWCGEAFERVATDVKLALVGDAPYAQITSARFAIQRDPRVVMPGAIYGQGYRELGSHCFAYVHATEVGGTHPALIEAMGRGALVLYLDTPENREVAGGAGLPSRPKPCAKALEQVLAMTRDERALWSERALERVRERYSWDAVTAAYERLFLSLAGGRSRDRAHRSWVEVSLAQIAELSGHPPAVGPDVEMHP